MLVMGGKGEKYLYIWCFTILPSFAAWTPLLCEHMGVRVCL